MTIISNCDITVGCYSNGYMALMETLHKKPRFPLRISSVTFTEEILNGRLRFFEVRTSSIYPWNTSTVWKVSILGVFLVRMRENTDHKIFEYGHFSRSKSRNDFVHPLKPSMKTFMDYHCIKVVPIRIFSGPYFLAFGLNTEI